MKNDFVIRDRMNSTLDRPVRMDFFMSMERRNFSPDKECLIRGSFSEVYKIEVHEPPYDTY